VDVSNWINLGLFLVTALGVAVAGRQALNAKRSATAALNHERAALAAATRSADAHQRTAEALEESNRLSAAAGRKPRWEIGEMGGNKHRLINQGPSRVRNVTISIDEDPGAFVPYSKLPKDVLHEGNALTFFVHPGVDSPADLTLVVEWDEDGADERKVVRHVL
jgi:hypothetical protein